ncbi:phosphate-starvation-inducible PsiE family protein [Maridesulfovibrio frigidus]|uniref:phosphate-starvation-inducible PsiE family protein n=1 Tax=Maridesulfovibrio frigidus TaxID=340956 RepID=UPI000690DFAF|nr:phosphate-starvation-inducible PsiE family protein [Maridesulfovibrio frigidus]
MFFFDKNTCKEPLEDVLVKRLWFIIRLSVRFLAILMTLVIIWGTLDVVWVLYQRMMTPPVFLLSINDILSTFGAFMAVLIAIEIFANIVIYLEYRMIHLKLVVATALMAAARKVIVLDFKVHDPGVIIALAAIIISLGACYWLIGRHEQRDESSLDPCNVDFNETDDI